MIDIHCHLLYGVDDGAKSLEESIGMLEEAKRQGITHIILTPHYRYRMFEYEKEKIESHFKELQPYADKLGLHIYLGTEYYVNSHIVELFQKGLCATLAGSEYVLTEYGYHSEYRMIFDMTQKLQLHGYQPVIAHVERYQSLLSDINHVRQLSEMGAKIQVNADAVLGREGLGVKRYCGKLLKERLVDMVASDSHGIKKRACHLGDSFKYIAKKYGMDYAKRLFLDNPADILKKSSEDLT